MVNIQTYPQLITVPLFCAGALFFGLLIFLFIYLRTNDKLYLGTTLMSFTAFGFVIMEGLVSFYGSGQHLFQTAVQFHRLEQLFGVLFLFAVPFFIHYLLDLPGSSKKVTKGLSLFGLAYTVFCVFIAFAVPDLFVSTENVVTELLPRIGHAGRGKEGIFYSLRDLFLGLLFLTVISLILIDMIKNRRTKYLITVLFGILIAGFFAADDIIHIYTNVHIGFLPNNPYARFPLGITLFLILSMTAVLRRFVNTANEVKRAYAALNETEQRSQPFGVLNRIDFIRIWIFG